MPRRRRGNFGRTCCFVSIPWNSVCHRCASGARTFRCSPAISGAATPLDQMSLEDVERVLIQKALARAGGNVSDAAKALGLSRSALYRRLKRHGL